MAGGLQSDLYDLAVCVWEVTQIPGLVFSASGKVGSLGLYKAILVMAVGGAGTRSDKLKNRRLFEPKS